MNSEQTNKPAERTELFCNQCHGYTHHTCLGVYERRLLDWGQDEEDDGPFPPFRDKSIKGHTLQGLIDGLVTILPSNIVANLHGLRFMGNMAVHELTPPQPCDLRMAIEICEDLLNFVYELDYKTARLGRLMKAKRHTPGSEEDS